jgi:hypothetical protein
MFPNCANPECTASFGKVREGNLFRFRRTHLAGDSPSNSHSVEHAWLCAMCCETHTLEYRNNRPVLMPVPVTILEHVPEPMPMRRRRTTRPMRRPRSRRAGPSNAGNSPVVVLAITPNGDFPDRS